MARPIKGAEKARDKMIGFRVPAATRAGLEKVAKARKMPLSDIANEAFDEYLTRHLKGGRRAA